MRGSLSVKFCLLSFAIALVPFGASCNVQNEKGKLRSSVSTKNSTPDTVEIANNSNSPRESITFILGEDKGTKNPYYAEATNYYKYNKNGKTNYLVTTCRSLLEVRNHLVKEQPSNHLPWGVINLVSHGDQWLGLSVKVTPQSKRSTLERVQDYLKKGTFKPLPDNIIDAQSEIIIHACGVGNSPEFVTTMGKVFRGIHSTPLVRAPVLFEYYSSIKQDSTVQESQKYFANAWITWYKRGQKPTDSALFVNLQKKYPNSKIDWRDALKRANPRWAGDVYHYAFDVPVISVIKLMNNDTAPDLSSDENKLAWINAQPEILKSLNNIQIPAENFEWSTQIVYTPTRKGIKSPAMLVKGFCTILCVLKPLTEESENKLVLRNPFVPELDDSEYYYSLKQ